MRRSRKVAPEPLSIAGCFMLLRYCTHAAILLAAASPLPAQRARLSVPAKIDSLPNGLRVIIHEDHSAPIVTVNLWYHVGSSDERPGRTGFAHLFEHLMFTGSLNAPYPAFDRLLEAAGAESNGSTTQDRTNYYESGPANALPLMLWLEADRMGWLLPTLTTERVDVQRDVVKNERRQSYENRLYGLAYETLLRMLYPSQHPYSWPTIGSMADLSAATTEDVKDFFDRYYSPNNAALVVAGDVKASEVLALVRRYFLEIPRGPAVQRAEAPPVTLTRDTVGVLEDRVPLPRIYLTWPSVPGYAPDDAALDLLAYVLAGEKNSRLTSRLVFQGQIATSVLAYQESGRVAGRFTIYATARPEHDLRQLQADLDDELRRLATDGVSAGELEQAKNATEASFLQRIERVADKADQLNAYYDRLGRPDYFELDLARYRAVTTDDVRRVARVYLGAHRVMLSVVPQGRQDLAVPVAEVTP
ncbi:MAG: M16 family metallopeptidase [Gemmatimonadales bacterium]